MRNNPEFNSFQEAREKDLSLREIKESIKKLSIEQRQQLSHEINRQIISELHKWMEVKRWDELNFLKALTLEWNRITWTSQREADTIHPWDIIKIEWDNILKNWNSIWKVEWFKIEENPQSQENTTIEANNQSNNNQETESQSQSSQETNSSENLTVQQQEQTVNQENWTNPTITETITQWATDVRDDFQEIFDNLTWANLSEEERLDVRAYSQDWKYYIIWENWEPVLYSSLWLNENFRESIETIWESNKKIWNFELIISALVNSEEDKYKNIKEEFNNKIQDLDISSMDSINSLLLWIDEKNNEITDWEPVNLNDKLEVISFIRDLDSNWANNLLVNELFNLTNISEEDLYAFIDNPSNNAENIRTLLWEEKYREVREKIREKKTQADNHFDDNKDLFIKQLIEKNWMDINQATELVEQQYKQSIIDSFVWSYARNEILLSYVEWLSETWNWHWYKWENKLMEMFSDIQWIGYLDARDSTLASIAFWSKEGFYILGTQIIAIAAWAVTMWAGYVWVNAAVWWTRWYRWIRALQTASNFANSWTKMARLAQVWRWWAMSTVWWASFYTWYAWVQSIAEWENMYSWEGLWESILYTWAFRALSSIPWLRIDPSKPLSQQKLKLAIATPLDAIAFSSIWLTLEWVILEPGEWNAELIMQAIVMAAIFRTWWATLQRMKFKTNWNNVEILEWASSTPIRFFRHSQTWKTYTRTLDWKFRNENWRVVSNLKVDNLVEVQVNEQVRRSTMDRIRTSSRESISNAWERIRWSLWKINESELISWAVQWLNHRRKVLFEKALNWLKNKWINTVTWTKNFLANLTYRGFWEWWPAFRNWVFYTWWTIYSSWEELNTLFDALNNKDDTIWKLEHIDEVWEIILNLTLFKSLWLIRASAYTWAIEKLFWDAETLEQETTE